MKSILLTKGLSTLIDDADFDFLSQWKWFAGSGRGGLYYAKRNSEYKRGEKRRTIFMHRVLCGSALEVDHIDGNSLNNQRANLRPCTRSENCANRKKPKHNKSGHKGVTWHKATGKWRATIKSKIHLGLFDNFSDAVAAYKSAALKSFGQFSKT